MLKRIQDLPLPASCILNWMIYVPVRISYEITSVNANQSISQSSGFVNKSPEYLQNWNAKIQTLSVSVVSFPFVISNVLAFFFRRFWLVRALKETTLRKMQDKPWHFARTFFKTEILLIKLLCFLGKLNLLFNDPSSEKQSRRILNLDRLTQ